jgi:Prokaryotic cytochrome b561
LWLLFGDGIAYLIYGFASGHFRRDLKPPRPAEVGHDLGAVLRFHLKHRMGHYNAVQRVLYAGVIVAIMLQLMTGLAIWKPVQFGWLSGLFGGDPIARGIHLTIMFGIVAFVLVHVALVAIHPSTLKSASACAGTVCMLTVGSLVTCTGMFAPAAPAGGACDWLELIAPWCARGANFMELGTSTHRRPRTLSIRSRQALVTFRRASQRRGGWLHGSV